MLPITLEIFYMFRNGQDRSLQSELLCTATQQTVCRAGCPHPAVEKPCWLQQTRQIICRGRYLHRPVCRAVPDAFTLKYGKRWPEGWPPRSTIPDFIISILSEFFAEAFLQKGRRTPIKITARSFRLRQSRAWRSGQGRCTTAWGKYHRRGAWSASFRR